MSYDHFLQTALIQREINFILTPILHENHIPYIVEKL
jgi:hypothetical protein